jgi:hypothetical protein
MPALPGKKLPYILDKLGLGARAAGRYVDSPRGAKLANKVEQRMFRGVGKTLHPMDRYSPEFAAKHRAMSIAARQRQVGGRYAAGGLGLGTMGMYNNRSSSARRGGPAPMTRARPGSGRNP